MSAAQQGGRPDRIAVAADAEGGGGRWQPLGADGSPAGPPAAVRDLAAAVADLEAARRPRWVWDSGEELYARLLPRLPGPLDRCHDVRLVEGVLLGHEGRFGEPRALGAAWARVHGLPVPDDLDAGTPEAAGGQSALFEADRSGLPPGTDPLAAVVAVHADQVRRLARAEQPARLRLLCAAESAGGLAAVEMARDGLPWRSERHDRLLAGLLGPRPPAGLQPRRLAELAQQVQQALGGRSFNPDSHTQVIRAFAAHRIHLPSTRTQVLEEIDHPAARLLLEYKELSRVHSAFGWAWQDAWARGGRLRPGYVVGGVVSGRWATRGGGGLQIPRMLRGAVVADPGWVLVAADAGQLEPRVLAAMSGDARMARAASAGDLYAALAGDAFGGDRERAKIALLAAMYGQTGGEAAHLLGVLRARFPQALALLEQAARDGEDGRVVRSWLGRTCPPPDEDWQDAADTATGAGAEDDAGRGGWARRAARGRFTRNFRVQATAADWALAMLAALRRRLHALPDTGGPRPRLAFFQHDEVIVHSPAERAQEVRAAVEAAGEEARRLLFGETPVRLPLESRTVECYADAK